MIQRVFSGRTQLVALSGLIATLIVSALPASAQQSRIARSEMSFCMATLIGQEYGSRINLRSGPGTDFPEKGYGLVGDRVHILRKAGGIPQDLAAVERRGSVWYRVGFPKSGARGWVREDFISPECSN
ncbi:SH3 domain-containing protein [Scytonema sp. UIC 10036]|uniref:SH3 domain-containing protein n=1 Tax=Scytonema sp. UIC 10036 TaxID=2304196 RepID=UPI001A9B18B8|nr:SH3 domain-containing protein [Scytonema sp. UIC 10036]